MKLERIQLTNYLSHASTTFELNGARLATIVGGNGAGKSSLLEAIKFVLYDDARAKTDSLVRLGETDMSASIEFIFAGGRYRATRGRTTRSGGKSYLELAVLNDETWMPLTGDDIRATQTSIAELLSLDANTFATAVYLGQGEANRFADATAGGRKQILGQVLGLERYVRAEARARDLARDLEARTNAERSHLQRTSDTIAELEPVRGVLATRQAELAGVATEYSEATAARDELNERIRAIDVELAAAAAVTADVARLEAEKAELLADCRRTTDAVTASRDAMVEATQAIALYGPSVDVAAAAMPGLNGELETMLEAERQDREFAVSVQSKRDEAATLARPYDQAVATWTAQVTAARASVEDLEARAAGLHPVICEKCKHPNVVDQADVRGRLRTARERLHELEAAEPKRPMAIDRAEAAATRADIARKALAFDPDAMVALQRRVRETQAAAARAGEVAAARATLEREQAAVTAGEASLERITVKGRDVATRLGELAAKAASTKELDVERGGKELERDTWKTTIDRLEDRRRELDQAIARAEAQIERLEQLVAERDTLAAGLASADTELGRLRRLITAFGVSGIPARIIESVLPELGRYANELLAELRPGMTLEIRAQREKKDGKGVVEALDLIVQDDVGERPLAVFSGGERMSVSLALAVGLSRLVARRAGTAIRTLVIDEPDGLDADARRAFGQALRVLAHHGELERVVLVSHHPDLAEYGDAVYEVTKNGTGSVVEQVA